MTLQAYKNTQRITEEPRTTEYRLFGQVTGALIDVQKAGHDSSPLLVDAIDWNKRLWRTLAADCMDDRNQLPQEVLAKIVSLSLWIAKYSRKVTREGASLDPLSQVNRTIIQGLRGAA